MESHYNFLLRTSDSAVDLAEILYPVAGLGPVGSAGEVYERCKSESRRLIYSYLDFAGFKDVEGKFLNTLPEGLQLQVVDKLVMEYQSFLNGFDMREMVENAENEVLERVEEYVWTKGLKDIPEALEMMMSNLYRCAMEYERLNAPVDNASLVAAYDVASKNTLTERLGGTNSNDILVYRQELIEYLEKVCASRMYALFERFFSILSSSSVFVDIRHKLKDMREYLLAGGFASPTQSEKTAEPVKVLGAVFTDLEERDPERTLKKYVALVNANR